MVHDETRLRQCAVCSHKKHPQNFENMKIANRLVPVCGDCRHELKGGHGPLSGGA